MYVEVRQTIKQHYGQAYKQHVQEDVQSTMGARRIFPGEGK